MKEPLVDPPGQGLYCHAACLRSAVSPGFPLGLLEDGLSEPSEVT